MAVTTTWSNTTNLPNAGYSKNTSTAAAVRPVVITEDGNIQLGDYLLTPDKLRALDLLIAQLYPECLV